MGPIGHIGIPIPVAHLLKLNIPVTVFCGLLPDIVDKPLWALGIGHSRYLAHTLLFVFLVAIAFGLKKRVYGLSALAGGILHLLLDWSNPWFYPFIDYDYTYFSEFNWSFFWPNYMWSSLLFKEILLVGALGLAVFLFPRLISWFKK